MFKFEDFKRDRELPFWYNDNVHKDLVKFIISDYTIIPAFKYLCDLSSQHKTRPQFDVKWAKTEIVDVINLYKKQINADKEAYEIVLYTFLKPYKF